MVGGSGAAAAAGIAGHGGIHHPLHLQRGDQPGPLELEILSHGPPPAAGRRRPGGRPGGAPAVPPGAHLGGRGVVEAQAQQVGAAVVAHAVHHSFALGDQAAVEFGDRQTLPLRQGTGQVAALRTDHRRVAAPLEGPVQGGIGGDRLVVGRIEPGGGADHEAARLQGVVPQGHGRLFAEDRPHQRPGNWAQWISSPWVIRAKRARGCSAPSRPATRSVPGGWAPP